MREALPTLRQWKDDGRRFAVATVVKTEGSAPRKVGAVMAVTDDGQVTGSVSGGCIDGAVVEACQSALASRLPTTASFPQAGPHGASLMCGGQSTVWVAPTPDLTDPPLWNDLNAYVDNDTACVLATRLDPFVQTVRRAGDVVCCSPLDSAIAEAHESRFSGLVEVGGEEWFMHVVPPRPRLVIVGAVHISRALVGFAEKLGFQTIVVDPRSAYSQFEAEPDKLFYEWPQDAFERIKFDRDTYAVALTHDPKIDDVAIELLLRSDAAYVGALGSKTTQEKRRQSLREKGVSDEQLAKIHGPVGLGIGAENPEEIALSIIAEIVQVRRAAR